MTTLVGLPDAQHHTDDTLVAMVESNSLTLVVWGHASGSATLAWSDGFRTDAEHYLTWTDAVAELGRAIAERVETYGQAAWNHPDH